MIELRDITMENFEECIDMDVEENQKHFVAPNMYSLAEAKADGVSVPLAICDGNAMVGFVMYDYDEEKKAGCISRLMVRKGCQRKGYGRQAMQQVIKRLKSIDGCKMIWTSFEPENNVAQKLYTDLGFEMTGEIRYDEAVCEMRL